MRNVLQCFFALCCSLGAIRSTASAQAFDRRAWEQDYTTLKAALEKRYSNLAWFASPEGGIDLPALDRRTLAALRSAESDEDGRSAILNFVRGFHDGHFSQLSTVEPPRTAPPPPPPSYQYTRQDAASGCAALGYAPNGLPAFSLSFESLPGLRIVADGIATPFRAGILKGDDSHARVGIVRIPSFEELSDFASCVSAWTHDDMWDTKGQLQRSKLRDFLERNWYEALAAILKHFTSDGVAAVMVDIGNNSGGDDSGDIAARLFSAKPLRSASLWMSQDSAASAPYFSEQLGAIRRALSLDSANRPAASALKTFLAQQPRLTTDVCPMSWVWETRRSWTGDSCRRLVEAGSAGGPFAFLSTDSVRSDVAAQLHWPSQVSTLWGSWSGPLYVLTDGRTYSSAEMFAAVLQNNRAAKTIGVRTGGDGCGFMNDPGPVILPNSHLRFRVPNCVRLRADGTSEVAGVKPDIPVLPTDRESGRARALRVVTEIRTDLASRAKT